MSGAAEVLGVGVDLCGVERMAAALSRTRGLAERLFTTSERELLTGGSGPVGPPSGVQAALLFAAKEAVMKSLGVGIDSIPFDCVEVVPGPVFDVLAEPSGHASGATSTAEGNRGTGVRVSLSGAALGRARGIGAERLEVTVDLLEGPEGTVAVAEALALG